LQPDVRVEKLEALLSRAISTPRAHMSSTLAFATSRAPVARVACREAEPRCATVSAADRARAMPTRATTSAAGIPSAKSGFAGPGTLKAPTRRDRAVAGSIPPGAGGDVSGDVSDASRARSRLVLYTKPGCCLCEGLEEKLGEIFRGGAGAASGDALRALEFETRDVSTNETWARKHASEVPVLSLVRANAVENGRGSSSPGEPAGETETETFLPRPAPRLSAARLATRLGQDVGVALRGDASARKGWATGQAVDAAPVEPSGGKGWAVVSEKPF